MRAISSTSLSFLKRLMAIIADVTPGVNRLYVPARRRKSIFEKPATLARFRLHSLNAVDRAPALPPHRGTRGCILGMDREAILHKNGQNLRSPLATTSVRLVGDIP